MPMLIPDPKSLPKAASLLLATLRERRTPLLLLHGPLGAGKTALARALCAQLRLTDTVCSPSFAILNEYRQQDGTPVYHFDLYRLNSLSEALDIGLPEYLDSGRLCIIEWPELIAPLLPEGAVHATLTPQPDGSRLLTIS